MSNTTPDKGIAKREAINEFELAICKALCIDPNSTKRVDIRIGSGRVDVFTEGFVSTEQGVTLLKRAFELVSWKEVKE